MSRLLGKIIGQKFHTRDCFPSPNVLMQTMGMLHVNVLGIMFNDTNVGFALYPCQSLMNHSSDPNCRCVTIWGDDKPDNPCLCGLEALCDIVPGEQLTIDYLGGMPKLSEQRRTTLLDQYGIVEIVNNIQINSDK